MSNFILVFAAALAFAVGGTPVARRLALRLNMIDIPNTRKLHRTPMPLLGGVAIYAAFILALLLSQNRYNIPQLISILVGATLVSFLGVWDDRRGLRPLLKLLGQVAAALILIHSGIQVHLFPNQALNRLRLQ